MVSNSTRWLSLILGILVLACGVWMLFSPPLETYIMIVLFIPIAILFHGISCISLYVGTNSDERTGSGWLLADGILSSIIGIWLLFRPELTGYALPYILAFWVLIAGILRIIGAFAAKGKVYGWGWFIVWGIIGIITGIFLLNHPLFTGVIITYAVIWGFIFMGLWSISMFFISKKGGDGGEVLTDEAEGEILTAEAAAEE